MKDNVDTSILTKAALVYIVNYNSIWVLTTGENSWTKANGRGSYRRLTLPMDCNDKKNKKVPVIRPEVAKDHLLGGQIIS